jgi:predicted site-specific integrase-resolvase
MIEVYTPNEIAHTLGISPKTLRAWLRNQARAGHIDHIWNQRWFFTRDERDEIIRQRKGV